MAIAPLNLALRFALEVAALLGLAVWAWSASAEPWRWVLVLAVPVIAAAIWGTFAVPGDPSRSGRAPVVVPGALRLLLELVILATGIAGYWISGYRWWAAILAGALVVHYVLAHDRIAWLLKR